MAKKATAAKRKATMSLLYLVIIALIALIVFCCFKIYTSIHQYTVGDQAYLGMVESYLTNTPEQDGTAQSGSTSTGTASGSSGSISDVAPIDPSAPQQSGAPAEGSGGGSGYNVVTVKPTVNFTALKADNADAFAWIYSPNTVISYPVVHGSDNEYYLTHLFDGTSNILGTIFVDCRNSANFADQNTLIYGHNMKNGSMFASLHSYTSQSYYDQHPYFYLDTQDATYRVEIFSAYLTTTTDACFCTNFGGDETYRQFLAGAKANSAVSTSVDVSAQDRIVTLVTCHSSNDDARFVVMGKLVQE